MKSILLIVLIFISGCSCKTKVVYADIPKPPVFKSPNLPIDIVLLNKEATVEDKVQSMYDSIILLEHEVEIRDAALDAYR
jgi:hypothetical protein